MCYLANTIDMTFCILSKLHFTLLCHNKISVISGKLARFHHVLWSNWPLTRKYSTDFHRMLILVLSRSGSKLGHVGSKARSPVQIKGKYVLTPLFIWCVWHLVRMFVSMKYRMNIWEDNCHSIYAVPCIVT